MKAQNSTIQSGGSQQNLFGEAVNPSACIKKSKYTTKLERQLAYSEAERIKLLAQITELKTQLGQQLANSEAECIKLLAQITELQTQLAQKQTTFAKERQGAEAIENLVKLLHDLLQRYEYLFPSMDEERQKAFRRSFAC